MNRAPTKRTSDGGPTTPATIADVALRAGVGKGTVSRVLNGGTVSALTRTRVEAVIAELDFAPSYAAQSLARGRVSTVAVVVPFVTHPSAVLRVQGIIEGLRPAALPVSILDVETPADAGAHFRSLLGRLRPEGVIVVSLVPADDVRDKLNASGLPVVWVDAKVGDHASVYVDDVAGGRIAAEHLISLGHRDIVFLGDDDADGFGFMSSEQRRRGFAAVMSEHGLDPTRCVSGRHSKAVAEQLASGLLSSPRPPTAIFAASDTQALGVMAAARARGVAVPHELAVVGFDDVEIAEVVGLTTVRQPIAESGRRAAQLLLAALGGTNDRSHVELPLELVERQSTGAAPNDAGAHDQ